MDLESAQFDKMIGLIRDSFRVRQNIRPIYVDIGGNLDRIRARQHQVVFGRRGSGKSCLLIHYLNNADSKKVVPVYILADEYKRLTYPDILIRLLIEILEAVPVRWRRWKWLARQPISTKTHAKKIRELLDMADEQSVVEEKAQRSSQDARATLEASGVSNAAAGVATDRSHERSPSFKERKIDTLERHLKDYKNAIVTTLGQWPGQTGSVLVDDFYLMPREWQPDVLDYLHRLVRDTDLYLKIATIRHRTTLLRNNPQPVGVELSQDVEEISLDRTLEDLEATQAFL